MLTLHTIRIDDIHDVTALRRGWASAANSPRRGAAAEVHNVPHSHLNKNTTCPWTVHVLKSMLQTYFLETYCGTNHNFLHTKSYLKLTHTLLLPLSRRCVRWFICLFMYLSSWLRKTHWTDLHQTWWGGGACTRKEHMKVWCRSFELSDCFPFPFSFLCCKSWTDVFRIVWPLWRNALYWMPL